MKQMKCRDNSRLKKSSFSDIRELIKAVADKTLGELEREGVFVFPEMLKSSADITRDQMILQSINDSYSTGNVMGFIGLGDERLVIHSRFDGENEDHFFKYLIEKVMDMPNIADLKTDTDTRGGLFNFLLFLYPYYLQRAVRKGLYKKYIRREYNDCNVKGTVDIVSHIKKNTPFTGNIAYSQREFSYDNSLTELIRHTAEFIKSKPYGSKLLARVKEEVKLVTEATPGYKLSQRRRVIEDNKKSPVRHAFFREYRVLQRLCLLILQSRRHEIGSGTKQIYGILFDGAWLWEEYINLLIGDMFYHPMNKGGKGAQRLFDGNMGLIYPDFIGRDKNFRIIADAKYKPMDNIGNHDYLQLLAYMFRFDSKAGYYLYPETTGADDLILHMNGGVTYESNIFPRSDVTVSKHGLKIPATAVSYDDFVLKMKIAEREFTMEFKNLLCGLQVTALNT